LLTFYVVNVEEHVKDKLGQYNENDIIFLKEKWQEYIGKKRFDLIEQKTGINIQAVYNVLNPSKIKHIKCTKYSPNRYEICLHHSSRFEVIVIIVFDQTPKREVRNSYLL